MILASLHKALADLDLEISHMELNDHACSREYRRLVSARKSIRKAINKLVDSEVA